MASFPIAGTSESSACSRSAPVRARPARVARARARAVRHAALPAAVGGVRADGDWLRRADLADSRHHRPLRDRGARVRLRVLGADHRAVPAPAVFGRRAAQAASVTFQVLFAVGLVQLLFFLPELGRILRAGGASQGLPRCRHCRPRGSSACTSSSREQPAPIRRRSAAGGRTDDRGRDYGGRSLCRELRPSVAAALEGVAPARQRSGRRSRNRWLAGVVNRPVTHAVRAFTIRTLFRSRTHRMMFAVYGGFALAIILSSAVSIALRNRGAGFWQPGISMMSMPLVAQFLLLIAIRRSWRSRRSRRPAGCSASASRRSPRRRERRARCDAAAGRAAHTAFALAAGVVFWTLGAALSCGVHLRAGPAAGGDPDLEDREAALRLHVLPGNSRIFSLWPIYMLAFFFYTVVFAAIDRALSSRPGKLAWFCLAATSAPASCSIAGTC